MKKTKFEGDSGKTKSEMKNKLISKEIEAHFEKHKVFEKINEVLRDAKVYELGLSLEGLKIAKLQAVNTEYCCVRREPAYEGGVLKNVCVEWSDGQNHSNGPHVPDC
jgi:hypothetical protein